MLNRAARALVIQIEFPYGVDTVSEKLNSNGTAHERRKDIHDSPAHRKLSRSPDGFLSEVSGVSQMFREQFLRDLITNANMDAEAIELFRGDQASGNGLD